MVSELLYNFHTWVEKLENRAAWWANRSIVCFFPVLLDKFQGCRFSPFFNTHLIEEPALSFSSEALPRHGRGALWTQAWLSSGGGTKDPELTSEKKTGLGLRITHCKANIDLRINYLYTGFSSKPQLYFNCPMFSIDAASWVMGIWDSWMFVRKNTMCREYLFELSSIRCSFLLFADHPLPRSVYLIQVGLHSWRQEWSLWPCLAVQCIKTPGLRWSFQRCKGVSPDDVQELLEGAFSLLCSSQWGRLWTESCHESLLSAWKLSQPTRQSGDREIFYSNAFIWAPDSNHVGS